MPSPGELLEEAGTIIRYTATLDRMALGLPMNFSLKCRFGANRRGFEKFEKAVQRVPEILECI